MNVTCQLVMTKSSSLHWAVCVLPLLPLLYYYIVYALPYHYHYLLYHYYHTNTLYSVGWLYNIRPTLFIQLTENQQKTATAMHIA